MYRFGDANKGTYQCRKKCRGSTRRKEEIGFCNLLLQKEGYNLQGMSRHSRGCQTTARVSIIPNNAIKYFINRHIKSDYFNARVVCMQNSLVIKKVDDI